VFNSLRVGRSHCPVHNPITYIILPL